MSTEPSVSCLMVTRNRVSLARRAVRCFLAQTWRNKQLVVVDDGDQDYSHVVGECREAGAHVLYHRLADGRDRTLGALRNFAIEHSDGEYLAQWDDDEWYAPERIEAQMAAMIRDGTDASVLKWTLMHLDTPEFARHPYRADVGAGTPGTIVHKRSDLRYPSLRKAEDSVFLDAHRRKRGISVLDRSASHLFIRCFHGKNTWDEGHFLKRLRRTPRDLVSYAIARLRGGVLLHPAFLLDERERAAASRFLAESADLGLLRSFG